MTDFLTRLIARSRGLQPEEGRVAPLIAPMYAAQPGALPLEEAAEVSVNPGSMKPATPAPAAAILRSVELRSDAAPPASLPAATETPVQGAIAAHALPAEYAAAPSISQPPAASPFTLSDAPSAAAEGTPAPVVEQMRERFLAEPAAATAQMLPPALQPQFVARLREPAVSSAPESKPPIAASVTKVTIGRIEVRAIHPPPAPVAQPAPLRPKLSLDDYLRTRKGRRE